MTQHSSLALLHVIRGNLHFKPKVEVSFTDAEGGSVNETLQFGELRDFEAQGGKGKLVQNSPFLSGVKENIDTNQKIRKSIEQNRKLRDILKEAGSREELKRCFSLCCLNWKVLINNLAWTHYGKEN